MHDEQEKYKTAAFDSQTIQCNWMMGKSQDQHKNQRREMLRSIAETNQLLAQEKKDRDKQNKDNEKKKDRDDLESYTNSTALRINPETYRDKWLK